MLEQLNNMLNNLRARMKMELNSDYNSYNPGRYYNYAEAALNLLKGLAGLIIHDSFNRPLAARVERECEYVIASYIRLLSNYISKKPHIYEEMYVQSGHHDLIRQIHECRPALMEGLVQEHPYAFMNMDDEWCAWVTILK